MAGKFKVVIDAGHGGSDSGAVGAVDGKRYFEKNLAWELSTLLVTALRETHGSKIDASIVPHNEKTNTPNRARFRNRVALAKDADLFLSIHWNAAGDPSVYGAEGWYKQGSKAGEHWATRVSKAVSKVMSNHWRGIHPDDANRHGSLGILTGHTESTKAALVEIAFITHPSEVRDYIKDPKKVVDAIVGAIVEELGIK